MDVRSRINIEKGMAMKSVGTQQFIGKAACKKHTGQSLCILKTNKLETYMQNPENK